MCGKSSSENILSGFLGGDGAGFSGHFPALFSTVRPTTPTRHRSHINGGKNLLTTGVLVATVAVSVEDDVVAVVVDSDFSS